MPQFNVSYLPDISITISDLVIFVCVTNQLHYASFRGSHCAFLMCEKKILLCVKNSGPTLHGLGS